MADVVATPDNPNPVGTDSDDTLTSATVVPEPFDIRFDGLSGDDEMNVSAPGQHTLLGNQGDDLINVFGDGDTTLNGGPGDDVLRAVGQGTYELSGGDGNDELLLVVASTSRLDGGAGDDIVSLTRLSDATVSLGDGNDELRIPTVPGGSDSVPTITDFSGGDRISFANAATLTALADAPDGRVSPNTVSVETEGDETTLRVEVTGDQTADAVIKLQGSFAVGDLALDGNTVTTGDMAPGFGVDDLSDAEQVAALYVGYYGRDPEQTGFDFWFDAHASREAQGQSDSEIVARFASEFANVTETRERYPFFDNPTEDGADAFVNDVFQQLFDRQVDQAGEDFFSDRIVDSLENDAPIGQIVLDIINGAQNDDVTVLQGKINAALEEVTIPTAAGVTATADVDGLVA